MDEPFGTLDHSLKNEIRSEVRRIIRTIQETQHLVTHQIDDATALADRIAVLEKGKLVQIGSSEGFTKHRAACMLLDCLER